MTKDATGFQAKVDVPWGTKVEYKFIVDGQWKTSEDAPIERDPSVSHTYVPLLSKLTFLCRSGRYVNNAYTAPPKPLPTVSSAISFVTDVFQTLSGAVRPKVYVYVCMFLPISFFQSPPSNIQPATPPVVVPPTARFPILPVKDASTDLPASPNTSKTNASAPASTEEPSTHKPVNVSRVQSSEALKSTSVPAPAPEPATPEAGPAVPEAVSTSEAAAPAPTTAAAQVPAKTDEPPAAAVPTEDKPALNGVHGQHSPQASLSAARASLSLIKEKAPFPAASEDGTTRSFSGTSSIKKKRGFTFGRSRASEISASDDGTESPGGSVRKKKRSIFGKIKHMFDHIDKEMK